MRTGSHGRTVSCHDGQQRLTTPSLMLAVLRHYFIDDAAQREEISTLLRIPGQTILGVEERSRLRLRDADQAFFEHYIVDDDLLGLGETTIDECDTVAKANIKQNVEAIREGLLEALEDGGALEFLQFVLSRVFLVVVATNNYVNAHRIFGVLNTRGLPLTAADIFKARVLGAVVEEHRDAYGEIWDSCIESLHAKEPDSFLHHLLVAATHSPGRRALLDEFDQVFERYLSGGGEYFIDDILVPYAAAYRQLAGDTDDLPKDCERQLDLLNQYQSEEWKPVAMWILVNVTSSSERLVLITGLERLYGVMVIARQGGEARSARLAMVLRALADAHDDGEPFDVRIAMNVSDDLRLNAVYRMKTALPKAGAVRRILLTRAHLAEAGSVDLPRSYSPLAIVPRSGVEGVAPDIEPEYWKQRLGGLLLSRARGADAGRKGSAEALQAYYESKRITPYSLASACPDLEELDTHALQQRHEQLVQLVAGYWGIVFDSEGVNLTALTESELLQTTGGYGIKRSRRVSLADVVTVGIISVGDVFVWRRPAKGDAFRVTVTEDRRLRLPNGTDVDSPSGAVTELTGSSASALDVGTIS